MFASFREAVLLPVLLAQALSVRRKALVLPEAAGPRQGVVGAGPKLRLLLLGDSSAAGVGVADQSEALLGQLLVRLQTRFEVEYHLIARTGVTTTQSLQMLQAEGSGPYDLAVVALGVNDVTRLVPVTAWVAQQEALHSILRERLGVGFICQSELPPMGLFPLLPDPLRGVLGARATGLTTALRGLTDGVSDTATVSLEFELNADNMAPDGYHPSAKVYAAWADRIIDVLPERFD